MMRFSNVSMGGSTGEWGRSPGGTARLARNSFAVRLGSNSIPKLLLGPKRRLKNGVSGVK
jgi:hypothetical protein